MRRQPKSGSPKHRSKAANTIQLSPKAVKILKDQNERFRKKFGRNPGPGDPVFFDPDKDEPTPIAENVLEDDLDRMIMDALKRDAIRPEMAYAIFQTRRIVTVDNEDLLTEHDLREWNSAVREYIELSTDHAKVFHVLTVEGSKVVDAKGADRLMALARTLGVETQVNCEIAKLTYN